MVLLSTLVYLFSHSPIDAHPLNNATSVCKFLEMELQLNGRVIDMRDTGFAFQCCSLCPNTYTDTHTPLFCELFWGDMKRHLPVTEHSS